MIYDLSEKNKTTLRWLKIGCPLPRTSKSSASIDFIQYFLKPNAAINEKIAQLYSDGLSVSDIADQVGWKRTRVWDSLNRARKELRSANPVPFERWRKGHGKGKARPPYGFCFLESRIVRDPREYSVLTMIRALVESGESISGIQRILAKKRILSRMGKPWSYNVIKAVVRRFSDGSIEKLESALKDKGD